jgi:8-oxo-dGTP pyrophosphatase MutT (NUDIX family)
LMRDGVSAPEIFMVKRAGGLGDVLGGAYVFPGGKVDADDAGDALLMRLSGHEASKTPMERESSAGAANAQDPLEAPWGAAFYVAAIRETFEEAGVLLGTWQPGANVQALRDRLNAGEAFATLANEASMQFETQHLAAYTRWITPEAAPKRFDARFFLAAMPAGQEASFDAKETTEGVWVTAADALARFEAGDFPLAPPTFKSLEELRAHASVADALASARAGARPEIMPIATKRGEDRVLIFPGDKDHPVSVKHLVGDTRMVWRGSKFVTLSVHRELPEAPPAA